MPTALDVNPGERHSLWTLLNPAEKSKAGKRRWLCRCDCGVERIVVLGDLRSGSSRCCGCQSPGSAGKMNSQWSHGMNGSAEYRVWHAIKTRCLNPAYKHYRYYGGRGIAVCDQWKNSFQAFYDYVGPRPSPNHTIDRINNDGNYEPGNVRWATWKEQSRNSRNAKLITFRGETHCVKDWSVIIGIEYSTLKRRLRGLPVEDAMTRPIGRWLQ